MPAIKPDTEAALCDAIKAAKQPLTIIGGGTRGIGRETSSDQLNMSGLSGVVDYEPGALTLVARAGTQLDEIEALLETENQRLAFEPYRLGGLLGSGGHSSIGGVIATNASGPRRIQAGAARDFTLGVRFVDGEGRLLKNGGRVMKNVTGYDLVKLMAGSWGRLGVLTEVSLKVMPKPEMSETLCVHINEPRRAVEALSDALGSPFEISAAAWYQSRCYLRIEGFEQSVAYRAEALSKHLSPFGTAERVPDFDWVSLRDAQPLADCAAIWRISVRPSDAPLIHETLPEETKTILDWGGGLIWVGLDSGDAKALHHSLQSQTATLGGHATLIKAQKELRNSVSAFQPQPPQIERLEAGLRAKFDPRALFNQGLVEAV